jgi:hypothetical protein
VRLPAALLAACAALLWGAGVRAGCLDLPPEGAGQVVLWLDVVDADAPREPPLIAIDSDGGYAVRRGDAVLRDAMSRADLAAMLESFVLGHRLPEIDGDAIRAALAAPGEGGVMRVADAPTSFLQLDLPGCRHAVRVFGSAFFAAARPDIDALQRFRAVEIRLLELATEVQTRP